jgi:hypothetical protein
MIEVDWRVAFIDYIQEHKLPPDIDSKSAEATRILRRNKEYVLVRGNLYKRGSASGILIKCVSTEEGKEILQEIHEVMCRNHAASRTLVGKVFRSSFYWPTIWADAKALIHRCTNYQFFSKQPHVLAHNLITIPPSWPFACWGLDMIGPLTTAPGHFTHVLVAIDKFTKWIEYKPIATHTADHVVTFICNILHRFGFLNTIITDLASNFHSYQFWDFYECSSIEIKYVFVDHLQANGQVEHANGLILDGLKKWLYDENSKKGYKWINELSSVIWGLRTQPSKATGQSPFFLVYKSEAILPADVMWKYP